jgi:hypothetical protein
VLVRVDVQAPPDPAFAREPIHVSLVVDGDGDDTLALADALVGQLSSQDRVAILDARGAREVVPSVPASHRSLALGALARRLGPLPPREARGADALAATLTRAGEIAGDGGRVIVLSDGAGGRAYAAEVRTALSALVALRIGVSAFGSGPHADAGALSALAAIGGGSYDTSAALDARIAAVRNDVPASGVTVFHDVVLTFEGTPAPSHVLEASGGEVTWRLDAGELALGDVRSGEARTEVVRVTVPAWVPGEMFAFTVTAHADDLARHVRREFAAQLPCAYDDDIERIAESRHGDVIAYASALATLSRLDAAFLGDSQPANVRALARMHARSMALLARDMHDPAMEEQAAVLEALTTSLDEATPAR